MYLVEKSSYTGGNVIKFEDVYPNMDCATCMIAPKQQELLDNENIELLTLSQVEAVNGSFGDFSVGIKKKAGYVDPENCIGCGACVASCRNASASLFVAAKLAHLAQLPQGQPERAKRAGEMQKRMEQEGFGSCSSNLECEAVCPQEISADWISWMHREQRS